MSQWRRAIGEPIISGPSGAGPQTEAHALERAELSPLGLLVRMVRDGDHRLAPPPAQKARDRTYRSHIWDHDA